MKVFLKYPRVLHEEGKSNIASRKAFAAGGPYEISAAMANHPYTKALMKLGDVTVAASAVEEEAPEPDKGKGKK